jgi:hypothetical protein
LLNRIIENDLPLFDAESEIAEDRRVAWLCRIDLFRETGRLTVALAWACLECELHPDNVAAQAVKDELKRLTRFGGRPPAGSTPAQTRIMRWQGLAGMRQLRAELEQDVIAPLLDPELYLHYRIPLPNGILLYGPPGCGKTFIASKLAGIIGFKYFDISPSDLGSVYVHGGQKLIRELFDKARSAAPAMIFFDEFDALVPARDGRAGHHYDAEVNELLTQLNECAERKILVVAATNRAEKIDRAVLRPGRFDKQFFVGPPDIEARVELFRLYLADRPAIGVDYLKLGQISEGYSNRLGTSRRRSLKRRIISKRSGGSQLIRSPTIPVRFSHRCGGCTQRSRSASRRAPRLRRQHVTSGLPPPGSLASPRQELTFRWRLRWHWRGGDATLSSPSQIVPPPQPNVPDIPLSSARWLAGRHDIAIVLGAREPSRCFPVAPRNGSRAERSGDI